MTQQINLLSKQRLAPPSLVWGAVVLVLFMAVQGGYGFWLLRENTAKQAQVAAQEVELQALREQVQRSGQRSQSATELQAEIDRLKPLAQAYAPLVDQVRNGSLGLATSYVPHFTTLARTVDPQIWLTQMSLSDAGRRLSLQGKATDEKSVLVYVDRLNQAFSSQNLSFVTMDLVVEGPEGNKPSPGTPLAPSAKTVSFRLN
jgi:Tfp pilus assembly protein PilN